MSRTRHLIAASLTGLALAAGGCDNDDDAPQRTNESPVNPDSPGGNQGQTTPAPEESQRPETDTGETAP